MSYASIFCLNCAKELLKYTNRFNNRCLVYKSVDINNRFSSLQGILFKSKFGNFCAARQSVSAVTEVEIIDFAEKKDRAVKSDDVNKSVESDLQPSGFQSRYPAKLEDVSDYAPATVPSFNLAAYVNNSPTLQELVKLGVQLYKFEKQKDVAELILRLNFEDIKKHLTFLYDSGIQADQLGDFISRNPLIFREDLDNLQIRINYLASKKFTKDMIERIISKNPKWLSFSTKEIDCRLGYFQSDFKLSGSEVRYLATKQPKLITYNLGHVKINKFSFVEEMGFNPDELKKLLLDKPLLFTKSEYWLSFFCQ